MTMMNERQRAAHLALVQDGLQNQRNSLLDELREQRGKLSRSVRLAGVDATWGRKEFADKAAARIEQILQQLKAVDARIAAGA